MAENDRAGAGAVQTAHPASRLAARGYERQSRDTRRSPEANVWLPHASRPLSRGGSALASALRHPLPMTAMPVAPGDRAGRVPGILDARDLLADLACGRAERVGADLAVRHAGAQRAHLGRGVVLRHAEAERLVLQLGEIRLDPGSRVALARVVFVGGGAQRRKTDLGIGDARTDVGEVLGGVALALAQLGGLRLD